MIHLRELWIDGFGCLRTPADPLHFERERITLFLDDNEAGKTTLQMAILASLYGIETHKGRQTTTLRPHEANWCPAAGPPFGTRLRLHDGRRRIELRWDFAHGNDLRAVDLDTNTLITEQLCPGADRTELGRTVLGLSLEEFLKTYLVRQDDLQGVRDSAGLDALVQRAADTRAGAHNVASAEEAIRGLLRSYPGAMLKGPGLLDNELSRLEEAIGKAAEQLKALEAERAAIAEDDAEFQRLIAERERLHQEAAQLDYLANAAELEELRQEIEKATKRRSALTALEAEREKLLPLRAFPADQVGQLTQWQMNRLGLLHNAEEMERTIAEQRSSALEPARAELEHLGSLAGATQDDLGAVQQLIGRARDLEAREQKHREDLAREEASLASQGASIEELDRLQERFAELGAADAQFLVGRDRDAARVASEIDEAKRLAAEAAQRSDRILAERQSQREAGRKTNLIGIGILGGVAAVSLLLAILNLLPAALALGVLGAGAGAWLAYRGHAAGLAAEALQADGLALAQRELGEAEARRNQLVTQQRELGQRFAALAAQFSYEQPEVMVDDYLSFQDLRRLCGNLPVLRSREAELAAQRADLDAEAAATFRRWGQERPIGAALSRALATLQERMAAARRARQRADEINLRLNEETERRDALRLEAEALTGKIRSLFAAAGIQQSESIERGINLFNERANQHQRFRQLNDELVPRAAAEVVDPKVAESWRADADRLHRAVATMREERPGLVSLQVAERSRVYRDRRGIAHQAEDVLRVKAEEIGGRVVETLRRYHAERPKLEDTLAQRGADLARARRHAAALRLAERLLGELASEVHGLWAEELNKSASALLQRVAPTLSDLKFDSRLSFGLRHRALPEPVRGTDHGPILSAGTWDQVCLAVRLAIADFVGRRTNGGLLLLDDPFAHFDDPRFEAAARLLAEFAQRHNQVILFSCQRQRFAWLRGRDPRWFDANIAIRSVRRAQPSSA